MGISVERAERHVRERCAALRNYAQNANWPKCLFHAAHVETTVDILRSGKIVSRKKLGIVRHDVANQGALANNELAHRYARLYFRPKNGFHLRTEGIKCLLDPYRLDCQMSVPVMLVFDAAAVLALPDTAFTDRNFAHQIVPGCDEAYFDRIPFDDVYHDRPPTPERMAEIQDRRMAEVVYPGDLPLSGYLRQIVCRTALDRETLLHLLGADAARFRRLVTVEQIHGSTFFHRGLYINNIGVVENKIHVGIKPPAQSPRNNRYEVKVERFANGAPVIMAEGSIGSEYIAFAVDIPQGVRCSHVRISLEGVLAFCGSISGQQSELF